MSVTYLEVSGLEKSYATTDASIHALRDVNMSIGKSEFVVIVGPSGCGKSTLLKILAGLIPKSGGSVQVDGREVTGPSPDVGIVFQTPLLLPWRTVLDNVMLPIDMAGERRAAYKERSERLVDLVGLGEFASRYPYELSGGMQQRASISRALVTDPAFLLMDEPFGALDAILREQMNLELQSIWMQERKTVCLITHSISEAVFLADRVVTMSPRPGTVTSDTVVELPRPRTLDMLASPDFVAIAGSIRQQMNEDAGGAE